MYQLTTNPFILQLTEKYESSEVTGGYEKAERKQESGASRNVPVLKQIGRKSHKKMLIETSYSISKITKAKKTGTSETKS